MRQFDLTPLYRSTVGFDRLFSLLDQTAGVETGVPGYPPYNIERILPDPSGAPDRLHITIAVAGFSRDELDITVEENQLVIRGRQAEQPERDYLYRGIAARQFQRMFVLADGMQVDGAALKNGLLTVDLVRPEPARMVRKINISVPE